jgi:hypothetical protein
MTRDEFDALPPTIQRKVSLSLSFSPGIHMHPQSIATATNY